MTTSAAIATVGVSELATKIKSFPIGKKTTAADSISFLSARAADAAKFNSVEHMAIAADDPQVADHALAKPLVHHMLALRSVIVRTLWPQERFVGVSVIDALILQWMHAGGAGDVVTAILKEVVLRTDRPGIIVFPATSVGLLGTGASLFDADQQQFVSTEFGLALIPQTNSLDATIRELNDVCAAFGTRTNVDRAAIEHWERSRSTKWLASNPLLIVKAATLPGDYFETEFLMREELKRAAILTSMFAVMQPELDWNDSRVMFSTSRINNHETLDLHHYLVLFDWDGRSAELDGFCVPMQGRMSLSELSSLQFDFDPTYWQDNDALARAIYDAVTIVHRQTRRARYEASPIPNAVLYSKLNESLQFFRRSFQDQHQQWIAAVGLSTAFETLLTDSYSGGVSQRLRRRVEILLEESSAATFAQLYAARGALVHQGKHPSIDLREAQRVFVWAFVEMVERLDAIGYTDLGPTPVATLLGDFAPTPGPMERAWAMLTRRK